MLQCVFVFTYFKVQSSEDTESLYGRSSDLRQDYDFSRLHQSWAPGRGDTFLQRWMVN